MSVPSKKLRVLFIDDQEFVTASELKKQGYDIEQKRDVDSLDEISDGRYHVIFFDVRGIGEKFGGDGLGLLEFVALKNPLTYRVVYSAKPFENDEPDRVRKFASKQIKKDASLYDFMSEIDTYSKAVSKEYVLSEMARAGIKLSWWQRYKLTRGYTISDGDVRILASRAKIATDAVKVTTNMLGIARSLFIILIP